MPPRTFAWDSRSCIRKESMRRSRDSAKGSATGRMTRKPIMAWDPHCPCNASGKRRSGSAFLYSKRTDEAIARFREGLRYGPDDAEAHYGLGSALSMQRKREDAIAELRQALRLRPNYAEAQELLHQLEH